MLSAPIPEIRKTKKEVNIQERDYKIELFLVKENIQFYPKSSKQSIWSLSLMALTFNYGSTV